MRSRTIKLKHGEISSPIFLPDATFGVVRSVDSQDLVKVGIDALVMNTFHLMQHPGSTTIQALGGLHQMTSWNGNIVTDSGGFQAYSLIRQNPKFGRIYDKGIAFTPDGSSRKYQLTPEKSVQLQIGYGTDVVICLDDCTHVDEDFNAQQEAVDRTIAWAKSSKRAFSKFINQKNFTEESRPKIFAVIQGGGFKELRLKCAEALLEIGFDGYGYGGWPLDKNNHLLSDIIGYTREVIPTEFPMHALGVGHPENVLACFNLGYDLFDSAMPTRDARHGRLFTFRNSPDSVDFGFSMPWFEYKYINDEENIKANLPISAYCDCPCCKNYSMGYLYHLFKQGDTLFMRLATLHNLRFMVQLCDRIRRRSD